MASGGQARALPCRRLYSGATEPIQLWTARCIAETSTLSLVAYPQGAAWTICLPACLGACPLSGHTSAPP